MSDELLDGPALLAQALQTRGILTDLIAELRTYNTTMGGRLPQSDPDLAALVDRAEARLRTLQTPGGPAGADLKEREGFE